MATRRQNILLLCCDAARITGTVENHISAFKEYSQNHLFILDSNIASSVDLDLDLFDVVVFHYSLIISRDAYLPAPFFQRLAAFRGPKILFIQDEFRWVDHTADAIRRLGIGVVFTTLNPDIARKIYRHSWLERVRFEHTLTGFVPEGLIKRPVPGFARRGIDVAYRARKLPAWCGFFAVQKWRIGERFLLDAPRHGLRCDIATSEASRIYGQAWIDFLAGSKAVLGTESGASFVDNTGETIEAVDAYEVAHPDASFAEIRDRFLEGRDGDVVIRLISPRCFEAAALRTLMILYPGQYSGILRAGRHYVPLAPDHSNMDEVVAILRDPARALAIIQNAYGEIACSGRWSFKAFIGHFDRVVNEVAQAAAPGRRGHHRIAVEAALARGFRKQARALARHDRRLAIPFSFERGRSLAARMATTSRPAAFARPGRRLARRLRPLLKRLPLAGGPRRNGRDR